MENTLLVSNVPNLQGHTLDTENNPVKPIYELAKNTSSKGDRISSGFQLFDESLDGGFKDGDVVVVTGISGQGKTSFCQTLTYELCKRTVPCLFFSYETSIEYLDKKFQSMGMSEHYYAYAPTKNESGRIDWIKEKIKEGKIKYGVKAVFIDHIGFLTATNLKSSDNYAMQLTGITRELKTLAIEENIIIFLVTHITKIPDNKEPDMQDIAYSSGIYQEADYVFIVWRLKNEVKSKLTESVGEIYSDESKIKIVKSRSTGKTPFIKMRYTSERFVPSSELTNVEIIC